MSEISFALLAAYEDGATVEDLADTLNLPTEWVRERIEAAVLCVRL